MSARLQRHGVLAPPGQDTGLKAGITPLLSRDGQLYGPPYIDEHLLKYLKAAFQTALSKDRDLRDYDRQLGHQEVIEHLAAIHQQQQQQE